MAVAGAEDDRFLFRPTGAQEQVEQVRGHGCNAVGHLQLALEGPGIVTLGKLFIVQILTGQGIGHLFAFQVGLLHAGLLLSLRLMVKEDIPLDDFTGRQVSVIYTLGHVVFIDWFAEIFAVIGGDLLILGEFLPVHAQSSGAGLQSGQFGLPVDCV